MSEAARAKAKRVFRTQQTVQYYEDALLRHSQKMRWMRSVLCPCMSPDTHQADPNCSLCKGRGHIYRTPRKFKVYQENAKHNRSGEVFPFYTPYVAGSVTVWRQGSALTLHPSQPTDGETVQLKSPYPKEWQKLLIDYEYTPEVSVTAEDSTVIGTNTLKTTATSLTEKGKTFEGSIKSVSRVYNKTQDESYTVEGAVKEYIYLTGMGNWTSGDVLEVDYVYVKPFDFLLMGISPKIRYEQPYVLDEASVTLVVPYWAGVAPDDLFTAMAVEQTATTVIDPRYTAGNDVIRNYYDVSKLLYVIDESGTEYEEGTDVVLRGRNELKWSSGKPSVKYSAQFTYHPTYRGLTQMSTLRNAENKAFANRINLMQYDHLSNEVRY